MNKNNEFRIDFKGIFLVEEQFKREPNFSPDIKLDIHFDIKHVLNKNNPITVQVELTSNIKILDDKDSLCGTICTIHMGIFDVETYGDEERKEKFIKYNLPPMMFPYVREHIASITAKSGLPQVMLPPLNIVAMLDRERQEQEVETASSQDSK